ncbi:MAG: lipopolysaccharide heptosyltransferase I [Burkholderiales bacterium]|nr:lipopolysaccharide heptosyltransferase I [Burkholderiales bacterium]
MPAILLIKTSSMGDVIHNLPVASDIHEHYPNASVSWVVEETFSPIPAMHPAVSNVIPVAIRRWRKCPFSRATRIEFAEFRNRIREEQYDLVIDTQGLFKSAVISKLARGARCGFDRKSAREPVASCFYDRTQFVDRNFHAVARNRMLAASCLGYSLENPMDYGIGVEAAPCAPYAVLLHATSRADKLWAELNWMALGKSLGMSVMLPWGCAEEKARSERIAAAIPDAVVPPKLSLQDAAKLIGGARIVVGVDTGLSHLAAALGVPVVGIYCSTDPGLTGIMSLKNGVNLGGKTCPPSVEDVLSACESL